MRIVPFALLIGLFSGSAFSLDQGETDPIVPDQPLVIGPALSDSDLMYGATHFADIYCSEKGYHRSSRIGIVSVDPRGSVKQLDNPIIFLSQRPAYRQIGRDAGRKVYAIASLTCMPFTNKAASGYQPKKLADINGVTLTENAWAVSEADGMASRSWKETQVKEQHHASGFDIFGIGSPDVLREE